MKIHLNINNKTLIPAAIFLILSIVTVFSAGVKIWILPIFLGLFLLFSNIKLELNKKLPWLWAGIMMVAGAAFTFFSIQFMLLEWELFLKITDDRIIINIACCMVVYLVMLLVSNNVTVMCIVSHSLLLLFGMINFFVYEFRGNEFSYADISSAFTGLSVASKYSFAINDRFVYVIMATILFITLAVKCRVKFEVPWQMWLIDILLIAACCIYVIYNSMGIITETWEQKGTYRNGYILNFLLEIRDSFVSEPEGYDEEMIELLEKEYPDLDGSRSEADVKKPTIIVIMSESYADLKVIGDFKTNQPVTPFADSLVENTVKGYALSSVYGAKTPNSEWEFLTGNSMAFLPDGSVVYQQYIDDKPSSMVSTLKANAYTCVAMHPYYETGWNRNTVYPNMGFDETYFIDDFDKDNTIREYIKDQELFDKIIDRYEKKADDENLFIMGVTMQNHGGYGEKYDNFDQRIFKLGTSYTDANQYLSLLNESDKALENLITYLSAKDDPVEVVFFGDHQPGLYNKFIELLNGKGVSGLTMDELQNLYTVPFFIWTNYKTDAKVMNTTSINYLSTLTLERANIDLPPYNQFLADMMMDIPAINGRGYYSKGRKRYIHIEDAVGDEAAWIKKYNILQYNGMFDDNRSKKFFSYGEEKQE